MQILPVALNDIWAMRQAVMYPRETYHLYNSTDDAAGIHHELYVNGELVSGISLFEKEHTVQFRKFAHQNNVAGRGLWNGVGWGGYNR